MNWSGILSILGKIGKFILSGIVKVFKWTFSNFKNFIIVLLVILCLAGACSLYRTKKDFERTKIELVESQDTTLVYKTKAGELYAACETYIADIKELKTANEELYKEYKNLKDHPIIIEKNKKLYFLTKCDNPYVQINNIEGAIVSPEQSKVFKKRFNRPWGVMIGVGPSITVIDNTVRIYPALQLTVGYKFISF